MIIRLLGGLLLLASCGKAVNIDHSALKEASALQTEKSSQSGVINKIAKSGNAYLLVGGYSHAISETSSYNAKLFIEKLPLGQTPVTFEGYKMNEKMVITKIHR